MSIAVIYSVNSVIVVNNLFSIIVSTHVDVNELLINIIIITLNLMYVDTH